MLAGCTCDSSSTCRRWRASSTSPGPQPCATRRSRRCRRASGGSRPTSGVQIVRRSRSFEGFTPEGERVVFWARQILGQRGRAAQRAVEHARRPFGAASDCRDPHGARGVFADHFAVPRSATRSVRISVESSSSCDIVAQIVDLQLDVGISYVDGEPLTGSVRTVPLYAEVYLLLTPTDGELAGQRRRGVVGVGGDPPLPAVAGDAEPADPRSAARRSRRARAAVDRGRRHLRAVPRTSRPASGRPSSPMRGSTCSAFRRVCGRSRWRRRPRASMSVCCYPRAFPLP